MLSEGHANRLLPLFSPQDIGSPGKRQRSKSVPSPSDSVSFPQMSRSLEVSIPVNVGWYPFTNDGFLLTWCMWKGGAVPVGLPQAWFSCGRADVVGLLEKAHVCESLHNSNIFSMGTCCSRLNFSFCEIFEDFIKAITYVVYNTTQTTVQCAVFMKQ